MAPRKFSHQADFKAHSLRRLDIGNSDLRRNHLLLLELGWNFNTGAGVFDKPTLLDFFPQQQPQNKSELVTNNLYPKFTTAENMRSAHHNPAESASDDADESLVANRLLGSAQHPPYQRAPNFRG